MHNWVQGVQGTVQPKFETIVDPDAPPPTSGCAATSPAGPPAVRSPLPP